MYSSTRKEKKRAVQQIDQKIIESIRNGYDDKALAYLYEKPFSSIRKYILANSGTQEDVNDIFQDAVINLFHQIKKGKFNTNYTIENFLYIVAKNLWINKAKKDKKMVVTDKELFNEQKDDNDPFKDLITKEKTAAMRKVFEMLDEKCRELMHYILHEKLSMKEISIKMNFSNEDVVKTKHYRCKQSLAKIIQNDKSLLALIRN